MNKAHNIISDVNLNIAEIRTSFQTSLHNKLSTQLVSPILLVEILKKTERLLSPSQSLLWGTNPKNVVSFYNQIKVTMHEPVGPEVTAIFSFNIPIISETHEYQHFQISTLPFIT